MLITDEALRVIRRRAARARWFAEHEPREYRPAPNYHAYIDSDQWLVFRESVLQAHEFACEDCGCQVRDALQVHHLHYHTLGCEDFDDVCVLCRTCHERADRVRAAMVCVQRIVRHGGSVSVQRRNESEAGRC